MILTGDPNNPNGGALERFAGAYIPLVDGSANGATPPNSPYPTTIYTNQYDAVADFPNYPLNVVSDVNALYGFLVTGTHDYGIAPAHPNPSTPIQLSTSPGYTGNTVYYESLTQNLPLVQPLRGIPVVGNALADLLQPDLRVLVDMGYATGDYPNIPTPAQLFEIPNPFIIGPRSCRGRGAGVSRVWCRHWTAAAVNVPQRISVCADAKSWAELPDGTAFGNRAFATVGS